MGKIVISDNVSLDGVIEDPAGDEGFRHGGWVGRIAALPEVGQGRARRGARAPRRCCWAGGATNGSPRGGHPGAASWRTG